MESCSGVGHVGFLWNVLESAVAVTPLGLSSIPEVTLSLSDPGQA